MKNIIDVHSLPEEPVSATPMESAVAPIESAPAPSRNKYFYKYVKYKKKYLQLRDLL